MTTKSLVFQKIQSRAVFVDSFSGSEIARRWAKKNIQLNESFYRINKIVRWKDPLSEFEYYGPEQAAGDSHFYEQLSQYKWYYSSEKWEFEKARSFVRSSDKVLDVGAGNGDFLGKLENPYKKLWASEINEKSLEVLRQKYNLLDLFGGEAVEQEGSFDVVASFQTMEHVIDPFAFLEKMINLLKPGGRLIVSVPNNTILCKVTSNRYDLLNMPPHHMILWNEKSLSDLPNHFPVQKENLFREPLALVHCRWFVNGFFRQILGIGKSPWKRYLINRYSLYPIELLLKMGLRNLLPGHTVLAVFRKMA